MLFDKEPVTPKGRLNALNRLFVEVARREERNTEPGHVPQEVLEAHGKLDCHVRFMLEAASQHPQNKGKNRLISKIMRLVDSLPSSIIATLPTQPEENWLSFYRKLVALHDLLEELAPDQDAEEYSALVQKMIQLAGSVADAAEVKIDGASMFSLLLIQVYLHKHTPARRRRTRRKTRSTKHRSVHPKSNQD